jgi:hypothetical protein
LYVPHHGSFRMHIKSCRQVILSLSLGKTVVTTRGVAAALATRRRQRRTMARRRVRRAD